jgi:hypothetical protein
MPRLDEVAPQIGAPYRTLARWLAEGLAEAPRLPARGHPFQLTEKTITELKQHVALCQAGLSKERIRQLIDTLRAQGYNPPSRGAFVVVDRHRGRVVRISEDEQHAARSSAGTSGATS